MVMPLEIMLKGVEMLNSANLTINIVGNLTLLHVMSKHVPKISYNKSHMILNLDLN